MMIELEPALWLRICLYISRIFGNWFAAIACGLYLAEPLANRLLPARWTLRADAVFSRRGRRAVLRLICFIALLVSGFWAYEGAMKGNYGTFYSLTRVPVG